MATDQEIRDAGYKFISNQQYLQNPFELPTNQTGGIGNTGGIANTNVSMSYMGYPSYEAWLAAQRGGDGGDGGDEDDGPSYGKSYGTTGSWNPGGTYKNPKGIFSQLQNLPTPFNLARKGITWGLDKFGEWNEARKAKKEQQVQSEIDAHNYHAAISVRDHAGTGGIGSPQSGKGGQPGTDKGEGSWKGAYGGIVGLAQGGRIGYNRGRVVNPGGYAGDDEGGILEWIKSIAGPESESNPTAFGTQDSLLNQGSIGELENAIKSYEALMMMGELDEEQQADYELKLNQLSALTEGATQKAHGGRVPFFYGGLASIL